MLNVKDKGILIYIVDHCKRIESKVKNINHKQFESDIDLKEIIFKLANLRKASPLILSQLSMGFLGKISKECVILLAMAMEPLI